MTPSGKIDFTTLKPEEFERHLPELFATTEGKVSEDPRLQELFFKYPDCLALVRDLETIAETARGLLEPADPSDQVWANIQSKLLEETGSIDLDDDTVEPAKPNGISTH
jgi:hypothetical protein